jgi:hypothetical protein
MAKTFLLGDLVAYKTADGRVALGNVINTNLPAGDGGTDMNKVRALDGTEPVVISDNCKLIVSVSEVS